MEAIGNSGAPGPALDVARMRERLGDDDELIADVIRLYLDDYPTRVRAIGAAIQTRDAGRLRVEAHALKGSAGALSALRVAEAARDLEMIGQAGDLGSAEQRFAVLVGETEQLAAFLRQLQTDKS